MFALALVIAAAETFCCDARHFMYEQAAHNVEVCTAHGGIPITEPVMDDSNHAFNILKQCAFPCDQRLTVEK